MVDGHTDGFRATLGKLRAWVDHPDAWRTFNPHIAVTALLDGYERLAEVHQQSVLDDGGGWYPYCRSCVQPWPCDSRRTIEEVLWDLARLIPDPDDLARRRSRAGAILSAGAVPVWVEQASGPGWPLPVRPPGT